MIKRNWNNDSNEPMKSKKELIFHEKSSDLRKAQKDKPLYGTTYLHPLIIIPKEDSIKCVLDARHLNSNTEQS